MSGPLAGQPIYILRKGSLRTKGREAQNNNIMAAKAVAAAVRTNLGPRAWILAKPVTRIRIY